MNRDVLKRFPNQLIERRYDECVGETWADIIGNLANQPMDAGYNYAAAFRCANWTPRASGTDPWSGGIGGVVYGAIPTDKEPFDATSTSEEYESDIAHYPLILRRLAINFTQNGLLQLNRWENIVNYLSGQKAGVQMGVRWYQSFNTPNADGMLPEPSGAYVEHCVAVYEDCMQGLRIKSWQGPNIGDGGYLYMSKSVFAKVFDDASAFNLQGNKWWNQAYTACTRPYLIKDILPQMQGQIPTFV